MSEENFVMTSDEKLVVCNMTSNGTKLKDAIAKVKANRGVGGAAPVKTKKKPSTKDRKEALKKEIEALGGEAPATNASVAKFEEALTTAKAAKATEEKAAEEKADDDLM